MAPENKTRLKPVSRSPHIATSHSQWTKTFKPIKTFGTCLFFWLRPFPHSDDDKTHANKSDRLTGCHGCQTGYLIILYPYDIVWTNRMQNAWSFWSKLTQLLSTRQLVGCAWEVPHEAHTHRWPKPLTAFYQQHKACSQDLRTSNSCHRKLEKVYCANLV